MKNITLLTIILFLFSCVTVDARHIISGTMGYECLGNDNYKITMVVFRDCNGGGASLDSPGYFSLYSSLSGVLEQQIMAEPVITTITEYLEPSCPPETEMQCIEKGVYEFEILIPMNPYDYYISYQRCCWSNDILNIESPEENGITITTTLTSYARSVCNTTDIVDVPMAFTACPGVETTIDFPSVDSEGDSLFYSLCLPYNGGGILGAQGFPGNPNGSDGVQPIPAIAGPYMDLEYAIGFDNDNPFPTEDGITFAPDSSSFSFTPSTLGYYLISYCITEVRDGQILGEYRMNTRGASLDVVDSTSSLEAISSMKAWYVKENSSFIIRNESELEDVKIRVYGINGELLKINRFSGGNVFHIEVNYPKGVYILSIEVDNATQIFKIPIY